MDKDKPKRVESGGTKYTRERERTRSLDSEWQSVVKATRVGSKGYGEYEEACKAANPENTPAVPKHRRLPGEMEEKPLNHGMFAIILSCLLSNIFLEVWRSTH